jgi:hypothetical protein
MLKHMLKHVLGMCLTRPYALGTVWSGLVWSVRESAERENSPGDTSDFVLATRLGFS